MDIHTDLDELQQQMTLIDATISDLQEICNTIRVKQQKSSALLEGNQFDIATDRINQTCQKVESSLSQLHSLKVYLQKLMTEIEIYVKCCYQG